ncbi:MAG: class I SAM-dependent methyltransferase [Candidatus Aenigmatarchaeota archaeon]
MNLKKYYNQQGLSIKKIGKIDIIRYKMLSKEIKPNSSVLDIGARNGELINFLPKDCKYTATDISETRVKRLKKMGIESYCFDICEELPNDLENKFDYVVLGEVIEHLPNPFNALKNINKVLKKGGFIIGTTPNLYSLTRILYRLFGGGPEKNNYEHIIAFDVLELRNMFLISGFKPIIIKRTKFMYIFDSFFGWFIFFKAQKI